MRVIINFDDIQSIEKAEKLKSEFENKGLSLIQTKVIGLNKFELIYDEVN